MKQTVQNPPPFAPEGQAPYGEYNCAQAGAPETPLNPELVKQARHKRRMGWLYKLLVLLLCLCVLLIVLYETIFRLEAVYVIGNEQKTAQEVVVASGLRSGQNIFSISAEDVEKAISKNHTLIFEDVHIEFPNTVYLYIRERKAVAAMSWLGIMYTLDGEGMVMAEITASQVDPDMPEVTGFRLTDVVVGRMLSVSSQAQMDAYQSIMLELYEQIYTSRVEKINLADPNNLFIETVEGITVRLGDASYMQAKICAVRTYMSYFRQLGKTGGLLDVTTPEDAKFQPDV